MINIDKITKIYNKNRLNRNVVLRNASLELPDTGFVFFVGRSGTGKSTVLNAIGGLTSYEGSILFDHKKVNIEQYRRRNIGYVFQNFLIFEDLSVYENIRIALNLIGIYDSDEIHSRTRILLKAVGLEINPSRRAGALSLGQRQRVAIARSLASNPKIILADEPTGNLDSKSSIIVMDILKKLSINHLVICVTHNLGLVNKYADMTFMIQDKQLVNFDKESSANISEAQVSKNINVADMKIDEYKDDNFLIKLYTQDSISDSENNNELKIIRQNGKILVVGSNISVASKNEIMFESDNSVNKKKRSNSEAIDLNFPSRHDRKSFKDSGFYQNLHKKIATRPTFKSTLNTLANIIFPIVLLIMFNILIAQVNSLNTTNLMPLNDHAVFVINSDRDDTSYDSMKYLDLLNDKDSGIFDYLSIDPGSISSSEIISTDQISYINDFDFTKDIISDTSIDDNQSIRYIVRNYADYRDIIPDNSLPVLQDDNQIYITTAIRNKIEESLDHPVFANRKSLDETLIDSNIAIHYLRYDQRYASQYLQIKGIISSDIPAIFASESTSMRLNQVSQTRSAHTLNMLDTIFTDYSFVEYDEIKDDPNYLFYNSDHSIVPSPGDAESVSDDVIFCYFSMPAMRSFYDTYFMNFQNSQKYYIENIQNPDKKIICFRDYLRSDNNESVDSSQVFINNFTSYCLDNALLDIPTDNILMASGTKPSEINEFALPESLQKFGAVQASDDFVVTGYYDDSQLIKKPILATSKYIESKLLPRFDSNYLANPGDLIHDGRTYLLMTHNIDETNSYLEGHDELGLQIISYNSIYKDYYSANVFADIYSSIISMGVLTGIFLIIVMLSNFSYVNKEKYHLGILRCLGYSKKELLEKNSSLILSDSMLNAIIPCLLFSILLIVFGVYNLGVLYTIIFYVAYILIMLISSNIPLLILLRKKPIDIIGSLN